jgi:hypothetical protein
MEHPLQMHGNPTRDRGYRNWIQTNLYHPEKMNLSGGMVVHQKSRSSPIHKMRDRVLGNSTLHVK